MSKSNKAVSEIKSLMKKFGFLSAEEFAQAKLVDGTVIEVEGELSEGSKVYVVTEEGNVGAPDGIHELESGEKVTTQDGVIVSIEGPVSEEEVLEEEVEIKEEEKIEEEMEEEVVEVEVPAAAAEVSAEVVQEIVDAIAPVLEEVAKLGEELKKMKDSYDKFRKESAGSPIKNGKTDKFSSEGGDIAKRLSELRKLYN